MVVLKVMCYYLTAQNYPGDQRKIWPRPSTAALAAGALAAHAFPPYSFTTVTVACVPAKDQPAAAIAALQPASSCGFVPPPPAPPPPPPPPPPSPFTWGKMKLDPSGADAWRVHGTDLVWSSATGHGRALVTATALPTSGTVTATVNMSFPADQPTGPTSILLRFDATDTHIGPGADDWIGYECAIQPGRASLGYHAHMYTALNDATGSFAARRRRGPLVILPPSFSFVLRIPISTRNVSEE
jgi:hypothetical protein